MRIVQFTADNFKRLVAVDITPDGDIVVLSGANGSGKTSALDGIWAALGGKSACPDKPIREGADKAEVRLVLDNGLVVERTFTEKGTYLKVTAEGGRQKFTKPQDMLDELVGKIAFDPLAFSRMKPKDQVVELLNVVDVGIDLDAHERERQALYEKRAEANREVKRLEGALAGQKRHEGAPAAVVAAGDLAAEITEQEACNAKRERTLERLGEIEAKVKELEAERMRLQGKLTEYKDVESLKTQLANIEVDNEMVRANGRYDQLNNEGCSARAAARELDLELKNHNAKKDHALAAAKFPVEGLSFDDEGVTYNGIPFAQCASSEQLKVAVAIAMAANPELRVIQIREGSLLDRESFDVIAELAGAGDYQVWVEVVDETGDVGIVIEDGRVVAKAAAEE